MTPSLFFIVPYRDREQQLLFFDRHMREVVLKNQDANSYLIVYVHQRDQRSFNRGALKNIGFLWVKSTFPESYADATFVFNDIDTMPYTENFLNYQTSQGVVKHFFGYTFSLGGIVSFIGRDFESINGFPNLWGWGFEDNACQKRAIAIGLRIDRSQFYPIMDKNIIQFKDGLERAVNRVDFDSYLANTPEGLLSLRDIQWNYEDLTSFLHVDAFNTGREEDMKYTKTHDLRKGSRPFQPRRRFTGTAMLFQ